LQLIGGMFDESTLLRVSHAFGALTGWHERRPPALAGASA
jgi:Asp-tRNA(Asn)/Glu-tRNA(Gln) amidotransferase A subunit family amidase